MILILVPSLLIFGGCSGWSTDPLILDGMERVYVPYFKNDTFYRRLEHDLTREVINRVNERPDLVLADADSAELILQGRISSYQQSVLSEDVRDNILESGATIYVEIEVVRAVDGKVLRTAQVQDSAEFNRLLNETVETARGESFAILSRKIVALLETGF